MSSLVVLKFGGSFLRGPADLVRAVHAIYAEVRAGRRVVAVTSAFYGRTDALEASLRALDLERGAQPAEHLRATLLATGENETCALLAAALERSGVPARTADVRRYGPFVEPGSSDPVRLDRAGLLALFDEAAVVCLPGFVAAEDTSERRPALLGRGGSDLTAVFVGAELGARVVLVKDVEGLYSSDPAARAPGAPQPRRLARVSFTDALELGPAILQPRALRYAERRGLEFEVVGPGHVCGVRGTRVGWLPSIERSQPATPPPLRVALLGLGTVGERVFAELSSAPDRFEVVAILVRDPVGVGATGRPRPRAAAPHLTAAFDAVLAASPDVIVEATGGLEPAASFMQRALARGIHVVTANKVAVAGAAGRLERTAREHGAEFSTSATVGGALPALEQVRRAASRETGRDRLLAIEGVLNGTSNAILSAMAGGTSFDEALRDAQTAGLAEADPRDDLDGTDVAHKIKLLARAAGWSPPRWLHSSGIDASTEAQREDGKRLRLVGAVHLSDVGPVASVAPRVVEPDDPLFDTLGAGNVLVLHFASGRRSVIRGTGAGAWPTATAILGDVLALSRRFAIVRPDAIARQGAVDAERDQPGANS